LARSGSTPGDRGGTLVPCTVVRTVLADNAVDLRVTAGEVHAICREKSAGKSTLMRMLSGVYSTRPPLTATKDNAAEILSDNLSSDRLSPPESGGRAGCAALSLPARRHDLHSVESRGTYSWTPSVPALCASQPPSEAAACRRHPSWL
jgi:energy-coupling factor transporter ATP-binding protein EcfA2